MEQVVVGTVTAVGAPLLLAGIVLLVTAILGHSIRVGPVDLPAPPEGGQPRWFLAGALLIVLAAAIIVGGLVALDRIDDGDGATDPPPATTATATATGSTATSVSEASLDDLTGEWRTRSASEGELLFVAINRGNSATEATIEGALQGRSGVLALPARASRFTDGVLVQGDPWPGETSVDQIRVATATRSGAELEVTLERCSVGQLGTSCATSSQTLVR